MENEKVKLLYYLLAGMVLSDILPTPADALVFYRQRVNKQNLEEGKITVKQYWINDAIQYYGYNPLWWIIVAGVTVSFGKTYEQKRNILIGVASAGVVAAVIYKNIAKDEEFYKNAVNKHFENK